MISYNAVKTAVEYAIYGLAFYAITIVSYRLVLHPLRGYPGPLAAKLTNGRNGYHAILRRLHLVSMRDHLTYGPIVRQGPNKLLFNSVTALQDIYNNERIVKSHVYTVSVQAPGVFNSFNVIDQQAHRTKRKVVANLLSERSMRTFEPIILQQLEIFLKLIRGSCTGSSPVNVSKRLDYLSCDIVGLLSFGYQLKLQTDDKHRFMVRGMYFGNYFTNARMQFFRLHQLRLRSIIHYFNTSILERYKKLLERMITNRMSQDEYARHDLYAVSSQASAEAIDPSESIRISEIWAEATLFFPAGAFSVATAMSALLFYLSRERRCYEKLAAEIRSTFQRADEIRSGQQLSSCQYLRACIDEALRIAPPIPGTGWRELKSSDGGSLVVDGHVVPPGTEVGVNTYALHHNEEYFPNPYKFEPERWLATETPEEQRNIMRAAFAPFSIGYRACTGKAMAYLESSLIIAKILWYFDFEIPPGPLGHVGGGKSGAAGGRDRVAEYQLYDVLSAAHEGPYLLFHPRKDTGDDLLSEGLTLQ